ncbi:hypothetical protein JKF63_02131 [Porcisia hertigi]|uniref:33 kDa inner dynein arm light chain, axonemal n=1 Tax=Porcisia hertigi TaxID=2761500 RepID=A0A836I7M7_9TRYP|nr:hypothetical protein JKF63_02131 [Porcisia hertigi]
MEQDLNAPLLQLNPPVLVRSTGGDLGSIDIIALRRATEEAAPVTPILASLHHLAKGGTAGVSLAARKLQDAKRTAHDMYRQARDINASVTLVVSPAPPSRAHNTHANEKVTGPLAGGATSKATVAYAAAAADMENSGHRTAADVRHPVHSDPPPPTARSTPSHGIAPTPAIGNVTHTAAAAFADSQKLSMNMQYFMRHVEDTGALLDTLFPIQKQTTAAARSSSVSHSRENRNREGSGEDVEQLVSIQTVSAVPASREDVVALHAKLRERLEARRARSTGLCPIRRALYRDLFSELVRQIIIEEPARGLLLARVCGEADHDIQVHATLLQEGERFASAKLLEETRDVHALKERIAILQQEKAVLQARQHELLEQCKEIGHRLEEERQVRNKHQQDELHYLRRANQQLSLRFKMETERESAGGEVEGTSGAAKADS